MRVLITGCAGFLGREIARQLTHRGDQVIGLVRRESPLLTALGIEQRRGDIRDEAAVIAACQGVDAVIHTAAIAGVWGPWDLYYQTNTLGARHCLAGCRKGKVPVLVYCSSPSVTFDGQPQCGIDESVGYPQRWLCHYPHTKALAEQEVLAAHQPGELHTLSLRPHLIWGPDDPHLFPRLVQRAKAGRLAIIGDGSNRIDTVHVENAALAHVLALDALQAGAQAGGRAYFVTQDEPVLCWEWIESLLKIAGVPMPKRRLSYAAAYRLGACLETVYGFLRKQAEPPMTRFVAAQLALDHWFDISAIKANLQYKPRISTEAGLEQMRRHWHDSNPA